MSGFKGEIGSLENILREKNGDKEELGGVTKNRTIADGGVCKVIMQISYIRHQDFLLRPALSSTVRLRGPPQPGF